ncbi:Conidiation protein 6-domain-containing protein [Umbelopsis sp. PMI_123]|nr:Conidiation protein 6-domain-containing protein [Umbelopsis sp. PMI_123]
MAPERQSYENKDPKNVVRGYKATVHNPRVSEEAKEHAKEKIDEITSQGQTTQGKSTELREDEARSAREMQNKAQARARNRVDSDEYGKQEQEAADEEEYEDYDEEA